MRLTILIMALLEGASLLAAAGQQLPEQPGVPLIPLPRSVEWTAERFPLGRLQAVVVSDTTLRKEAAAFLAAEGWELPVAYGKREREYTLRL
ncbi:MAG TPA: hypothetical protein VD772_07860, partial [Anseongella sp.]|nr:hypothetical protein [Anseongella sp.]